MPTTERTTREGGTAPLTIADLPRALRHLTREGLLDALQAQDPNGCYTDELGALEGHDPITEAEAVGLALTPDGWDMLAWLIAHFGLREPEPAASPERPIPADVADTLFELVTHLDVDACVRAMKRDMDETGQSGSARDAFRALVLSLAGRLETEVARQGGWEGFDWYIATQFAATALQQCVQDAEAGGARMYYGYPALGSIVAESLAAENGR